MNVRGETMMDLNKVFMQKEFIGVFLVLNSNLHVEQANSKFLELSGYSLEELKSIKFPDLILPNDKTKFFDVLYGSLVTQDITIKIYHKSGAFRFFSLIIQSFSDAIIVMGNAIKKDYFGQDYFNDLNKDRIASFIQEEVEDIKDLLTFKDTSLNFIMDMLPIDVWIKDKYGKYIYCNKEFSKHTNLSLEDISNKTDYQVYDSDIAREFETSDNNAIKSGAPLTFLFESKSEQLLTWTEVTKIPLFNKHKDYIGIFGFSVDISGSKNIETNYEEKLNQLENIVENIEGIVFEVNPYGTILYSAGKLSEDFFDEASGKFAALDFIEGKNDPKLREKIRYALGGNRVKIVTSVRNQQVEFVLIPVLNKYQTYNLIGYGIILGDDNE